MTRPTVTTWMLLFWGMALFGSATPLSKIVASEFPIFTASTFRVGIGALVLLPFLGERRHAIARLTRRDWTTVGAIAVVGMFAFTALMLVGMRLVPGVVGAIIMSATPAITATGAVLFQGDRWNRPKSIALVLGVAGVLIANATGADDDNGGQGLSSIALGSLLVFAAVCCEAGYTLIGKRATERLDPMLTVFLSSVLAIPLFVLAVLVFERDATGLANVDPVNWIVLLAWGGVTLGLGSILWYAGLQRAEGSIAAGFMGVMPISALVLSYVLLDEPVRALHLVGFVVVFAGVVIMAREHARHGH